MVTAHTEVMKNFHSLTPKVQNTKIWKDRAHEYFDVIWQQRKYTERNKLYEHLGNYLNRNPHIGSMKEGPCRRVIKWSIDVLNTCAKKEHEFGIHIHGLIEYPDYL